MRRVVAGLVFAIASCAVMLWPHAITAQLNSNSFAPPAWYNAGANQTWAVTAGDLNNDGFADVVVTSHCYDAQSCNTGIGVFLNDGTGGLLPGVRYESGAPGGDANQSVAIADLDGDGARPGGAERLWKWPAWPIDGPESVCQLRAWQWRWDLSDDGELPPEHPSECGGHPQQTDGG